MKWPNVDGLLWSSEISNLPAKQRAAAGLAAKVKDGDVIGVGSGSTSFVTLQTIGARISKEGLRCSAIPTSFEMAAACAALGIPVTSLTHARPDWSFDGADEIDGSGNLIKGRGGALFQEKLLMVSSPETFIVADESKIVAALGKTFPIPVEVHPLAVRYVQGELPRLGAAVVTLRLALRKDGPVFTENGNLLLDARFDVVTATLEREIKAVVGVVETGLFWGYRPTVITAV